MKLLINIFFILILSSCEVKNDNFINNNILKNNNNNNLPDNSYTKYVLGEPYFIKGVKYIPKENYNYKEVGLASFYGKELHNTQTVNNDLNKVTELLGRHKTLPLPSIVKVTNLDNGLFLIIKINDRHSDNSSLIQLSRKSAQLLKFYKNKIAKVKVEILPDPSKQMKVVTESMNESTFGLTIESAPTENVSISNIGEENTNLQESIYLDDPVEIGFDNITNKELFLKIYEFKSYNEAKNIISELKILYTFSTMNEGDSYSLLLGPLENQEANNLVLSFISKGYKKTEFILK